MNMTQRSRLSNIKALQQPKADLALQKDQNMPSNWNKIDERSSSFNSVGDVSDSALIIQCEFSNLHFSETPIDNMLNSNLDVCENNSDHSSSEGWGMIIWTSRDVDRPFSKEEVSQEALSASQQSETKQKHRLDCTTRVTIDIEDIQASSHNLLFDKLPFNINDSNLLESRTAAAFDDDPVYQGTLAEKGMFACIGAWAYN